MALQKEYRDGEIAWRKYEKQVMELDENGDMISSLKEPKPKGNFEDTVEIPYDMVECEGCSSCDGCKKNIEKL